jgi:hypothetical protein
MVSRPWICHFRPARPSRDGDEAACVNIRSVRPRRVTTPSSHNTIPSRDHGLHFHDASFT